MVLFGLEVLNVVLGVDQYITIETARFFIINNSKSIHGINVLIKILISVLASVMVYNLVCYFYFKYLYGKNGINIEYKGFAKALLHKHLIAMAIVIVPMDIIIEIIINKLMIGGEFIKFKGRLLVCFLEILKNAVLFYTLLIISNRYIVKVNGLGDISDSDFKKTWGKIIVMIIIVILVNAPIASYLKKSQYYLAPRKNFLIYPYTGFFDHILHSYVNIFSIMAGFIYMLLRTIYNMFIALYISIAMHEVTLHENAKL